MSIEHDCLPGCTCRFPIACWVIRCHARQITRGLCLSVFFVPLFLWPLVSWTVPIPPTEGALCIDFLLPSISFFEALATLTKPTWATCYQTSTKMGPATTSSTSTSYWRVSTPVVWRHYQHLQVLYLNLRSWCNRRLDLWGIQILDLDVKTVNGQDAVHSCLLLTYK